MKAQEPKTMLDQFTVVKRAIVYARVSSDEQAENTSLDNQVEKGIDYAKAHNMRVIGVYREDYTGTTLDRPEMNKVRAMLQAGQADTLIIYNPSRLDRSKFGVNTLILMVELQNLGVELHYSELGKQVDLNNHMDVFVYGSLGGWQAGKDRDDTVKKLHDGRINRVRSGYVVPSGKTPYGYRAVQGDDKRWYFEIIEEEAEVIRLIFRLYLLGDESKKPMGLWTVARKLTELKIPTRGDKDKRYAKQNKACVWSPATIGTILDNETYVGTWHYRKRTSEQDEWIAVDVPAIITQDVWQAARERRERNRANSPRRTEFEYLLRGRVVCGKCGYKLGCVHRKNRYQYYYCWTKNDKTRPRSCDLPYFRADALDPAVWQWIEETLTDEKKLQAGIDDYLAGLESETNPIQDEYRLVVTSLAEQETLWADAMANMKAAKSPRAKAVFADDLDRIEGAIEELKKQQAELETKLEVKQVECQDVLSLKEFAQTMREDLEVFRNDFESRLLLVDRLNLQVKVMIEDGQQIAYVKAIISNKEEALALSLENTSTGSNIHKEPRWAYTLTGRLVIG